jgi:hypothetical protein
MEIEDLTPTAVHHLGSAGHAGYDEANARRLVAFTNNILVSLDVGLANRQLS